MTAPTSTPNRATSTHPERSSRRVAHKSPLGWLPWALLAALLLLLLLVGLGIAAANDDDSSRTATSSQSQADLGTATSGALVGGAGAAPAPVSAPVGNPDTSTAGTVLFAEDSAAIDANGKKVIATAAQHLKAAKVTRVVVEGYTDVVAGQPVNKALSMARADNVAQALRALLPGVQITTAAKAEADPVAPNSTPAGRQQNRRAAIVAKA